MTIIVDDWGKDEYLDGAMARFAICKNNNGDGEPLAFCLTTIEDACAIARTFADDDEEVTVIHRRQC